MLERLVNKKTQELQQALTEIARIATTDKLTGLSNRLKIDVYLDTAIQRAQDTAYPLSLILLDLDHFKRINDTYGHLQGDRVLSALCASIDRVLHWDEARDQGEIYCLWGQFQVRRECIRDGVRWDRRFPLARSKTYLGELACSGRNIVAGFDGDGWLVEL
ncbi:diguanylate cyclase domain-containing protein [Allochromatium palmeri]|uniref:diguanylate cyclase n=1 Tax=Allochromatium palmeri TaxID=231048 RepID=A0A6N8EI95_9GAMM|nr:diguanylate cyclase [Allochromatium palmeri]